jgi:DNA-binding NtrC family response regulator
MTTAIESRQERILIVEDDHGLNQLLAEEVHDNGFLVKTTASIEEGRSLLMTWDPDLMVSDLRLPDGNALDLLQETRSLHVPPGFMVITAFGTIPEAVRALKAGADDFLTKPLDLDHFMISLSRVLETRRLKQEVRRFREVLGGERFHGILGRSRPMRILFDLITQIAQARGPVLILGESGVGKELVAHAIHRESPRASAPFLAINCVAIPENLMESELFGHVAGAFTGATNARKGLFEEANGGTLLLDEIGEMPLQLQGKLLRILEDGHVRPLGSSRTQHVDVRILAATNRDLKSAIDEGQFREDLYYRLETFTLRIPPLRERGEDIELLAGYFLGQFGMQMGKSISGLSPEALQRLKTYTYPGNIRELQSMLERAVTFCQGDTVLLEHLPPSLRQPLMMEESSTSQKQNSEEPHGLFAPQILVPLAEVEQRYIRYVLNKVHGNKRQAAALLRIGRRTLYRRLGEDAEVEEERNEES